MKTKEEWIKTTMQSIDNIQRADVSPQLEERLSRINQVKGKIISMRPIVKWSVAASIALLIGFNIVSIIQYNKTSSANQTESNPVYSEYFSHLNDL